jgi:hypothetical protein
VKGIVQAAKDLKIDIVLVHEQDSQEGGCEFSQFFKQTKWRPHCTQGANTVLPADE